MPRTETAEEMGKSLGVSHAAATLAREGGLNGVPDAGGETDEGTSKRQRERRSAVAIGETHSIKRARSRITARFKNRGPIL